MTRFLVILCIVLWLIGLVVCLFSAPISPDVHAMILAIGDHYGVPRSVANQLHIEESGDWRSGTWGDAAAVGPVGSDGFRCRGLYQLNPRIEAWLVARFYPHEARYFNVYNPLDNATVALSYLAWLHRQLGTWYAAACFYNAGRVAYVPEETREYAARIIEAR